MKKTLKKTPRLNLSLWVRTKTQTEHLYFPLKPNNTTLWDLFVAFISPCSVLCLRRPDTEEVRIYGLSVCSSVWRSLMHTALRFSLIYHCVRAESRSCASPPPPNEAMISVKAPGLCLLSLHPQTNPPLPRVLLWRMTLDSCQNT